MNFLNDFSPKVVTSRTSCVSEIYYNSVQVLLLYIPGLIKCISMYNHCAAMPIYGFQRVY